MRFRTYEESFIILIVQQLDATAYLPHHLFDDAEFLADFDEGGDGFV